MKRSFSACEFDGGFSGPALSKPANRNAQEPPSDDGWSYEMWQGARGKPGAFRPLDMHPNWGSPPQARLIATGAADRPVHPSIGDIIVILVLDGQRRRSPPASAPCRTPRHQVSPWP